MRIILLACLIALAASKAIHNKDIGCGGGPGGLSCIHPVPVPQSIPWYGYPWAYSAYQTPVVNTPASYEPLCAILNGAFHTFANIGEFIEAVRNGYDFKFYCNGPCPPTQIACSVTEPFCASDGVITKTFYNTCDLAKERIATGRVWIQVSQGACPNESQFDTSAAPVSSETAPATENASSSTPADIASGETSPASNASSDSSAETSLASNASSDSSAETSSASNASSDISAETSPASNASSDSSAESSPASNASSDNSPVSSSISDPTDAPSESTSTSPIPSDSSPVSSSTLDPTTNDVIFVSSSSTWPASISTSEPTVNDVIANESSSTAIPATSTTTSKTSAQSSSSASETHYESFSAGEANFDVFSEPQSSDVSSKDVIVNPDSVTINPAIVNVSALNDIQEAPSDDTESLQSSSISAEDIIAALLKSQPRWPAAAGRPAASKISFRNNIGNSYDIYAEGNVYNNNGKKQRNSRRTGLASALSFLAKFRPHN